MTQISEFDTTQNSPPQAQMPQPNERGEYTRTSHRYWQVVDPDPNGLNCRMGPHSIREIENPGSKIDLNIGSWPVVGTLKEGEKFEIYLGPSGLGVLYDDRDRPWFFVQKSENIDGPGNGFVRAHSSLVQPVQPN